jgi:uncharacterized repeat protein (TIGR04138 family)
MTDMIDAIFELSKKHGKYPPGAYILVFEVLDFVSKEMKKPKQHLTGRQLALSTFAYCLHRYGGLSKMVWENLGMASSEDLGQIVFHLVEEGLIGRQEQDRVEDFDQIYTINDFDGVKTDIVGEPGRWLQVAEKGKGFDIQYAPPEKLGLSGE